MREWKRSVEGNIRAMGGIQLRVEKVMGRHHQPRDGAARPAPAVPGHRRLDLRPFIGLFGTVWGIMTSFQAIAASKNTNLRWWRRASPEALFATALGLLAAIPAVIFYNKFAADSSRLSQRSSLRRRVLGHRVSARSTCRPRRAEIGANGGQHPTTSKTLEAVGAAVRASTPPCTRSTSRPSST
jgi:hypothetical protein